MRRAQPARRLHQDLRLQGLDPGQRDLMNEGMRNDGCSNNNNRRPHSLTQQHSSRNNQRVKEDESIAIRGKARQTDIVAERSALSRVGLRVLVSQSVSHA